MERKICKSMREFTRINRKRQMLMSHCSLREINHLPFLGVTGTSCSSRGDLLTWAIFNNSLLIQSSSCLKAPWRSEKHDIISCPCCSLPETPLVAGGISPCVWTGRNRAWKRAYKQTRITLLVGGCSGPVALYAQYRPYSIHHSYSKKLA